MYRRAEADSLDHLADGDLVAAFKRGDDAALEILLRRHADDLYRFCCHLVPNRQDAEDICQESLIRAINHVDSLQSGSAFRAWLFRIARNLSIDTLRSRRRTCTLVDQEVAPVQLRVDGPQATLEVREEYQTVAQALNRLRPSHRSVLLLREVEGLSYAQIARALDISESAVETLLFRARRRLRDEYRRGESSTQGAVAALGARGLIGRWIASLGGGVSAGTKVAATALVVGGAVFSASQSLPPGARVQLHSAAASAAGRAALPGPVIRGDGAHGSPVSRGSDPSAPIARAPLALSQQHPLVRRERAGAGRIVGRSRPVVATLDPNPAVSQAHGILRTGPRSVISPTSDVAGGSSAVAAESAPRPPIRAPRESAPPSSPQSSHGSETGSGGGAGPSGALATSTRGRAPVTPHAGPASATSGPSHPGADSGSAGRSNGHGAGDVSPRGASSGQADRPEASQGSPPGQAGRENGSSEGSGSESRSAEDGPSRNAPAGEAEGRPAARGESSAAPQSADRTAGSPPGSGRPDGEVTGQTPRGQGAGPASGATTKPDRGKGG